MNAQPSRQLLAGALFGALALLTILPVAQATGLSWQQAGEILAARLNDREARAYHEELSRLLVENPERIALQKATPRMTWSFSTQQCRLFGTSADQKLIVDMKKLKEAVPNGATRLDLKCESGVQCVSVLRRQGSSWASNSAFGVNRDFKSVTRKQIVRTMVKHVYAGCGPGGRA